MSDAIGLLEGNQVEFSDAEAAYTQAKLKGIDTFIDLPKEQWPDSWHKLPYDDPVCPSILCTATPILAATENNTATSMLNPLALDRFTLRVGVHATGIVVENALWSFTSMTSKWQALPKP